MAGLALAPVEAVALQAPAAVAAGLLCVIVGRAAVRAAGWARPGRPGGVPPRATVGLSVVLAALAGLLAGLPSGTAARRACVATLEAGAPAVAVGTLADGVPERRAGREAGLVRVSIRDVHIVSGGRICRLGAVRGFVRPGAGQVAGAAVLARGTWRTAGGTNPEAGRARLPRPPGTVGWIGGATLEPLDVPANAVGPRGPGRWISGSQGVRIRAGNHVSLIRTARSAFPALGLRRIPRGSMAGNLPSSGGSSRGFTTDAPARCGHR